MGEFITISITMIYAQAAHMIAGFLIATTSLAATTCERRYAVLLYSHVIYFKAHVACESAEVRRKSASI